MIDRVILVDAGGKRYKIGEILRMSFMAPKCAMTSSHESSHESHLRLAALWSVNQLQLSFPRGLDINCFVLRDDKEFLLICCYTSERSSTVLMYIE